MLKKIIHTFGIRALSAVINLLIAILLSQYLGPEGKGIQSIIITTISFILIFSNLAGGATLVYLAPRFEAYLLLIPSYIWSLAAGLVSYAVLSMTSLVDPAFILHICILAFINSVMTIHTNIMLGRQQVMASNYIVLLQSVVLVLSLLAEFFILRNFSVTAYIHSLYVSFLLMALISVFWIRKDFAGKPVMNAGLYLPVITKMFGYGVQNQVAHITQLLSFRLSFYVLEQYRGMSSVGIFSNGVSVAESVWLISKSMALVQYSYVSNSSNKEASARITTLLIMASLLISALILFPLLIMPSEFYVFVFGNGFAEVRPVILALAPGVLFYCISILIGHYYSGSGKYFMNTYISGAGLIASACLYFSLIPAYSILGAAMATSISYAFTSLLFAWFFTRENRTWYTWLKWGKEDLRKMLRKSEFKN